MAEAGDVGVVGDFVVADKALEANRLLVNGLTPKRALLWWVERLGIFANDYSVYAACGEREVDPKLWTAKGVV